MDKMYGVKMTTLKERKKMLKRAIDSTTSWEELIFLLRCLVDCADAREKYGEERTHCFEKKKKWRLWFWK